MTCPPFFFPRPLLGLAPLLALVLMLSGCQLAGWVAHGVAGGEKTVQIKAQYRGMEGKSVAVIVGTDENTLYAYPTAPLAIAQSVSARLAEGVPSARLTDPQQIAQFQRANPYWETLPPGDLIKRLAVDRLVFVDLIRYTTHDPGDKNVWQGAIVARVDVYDSQNANPNDRVFSAPVQASFPESRAIGVLDADEKTIQLGMLKTFSLRAAGLFFDYEETRK